MNRLEYIVPQMVGGPDYNMRLLLSTLTPITIVPRPDKYYVFIYKAKTPNIQYDQHPFISCLNVYPWGFTGFNFHWNEPRKYTWREVLSNLYRVEEDEVDTVKQLPIAKFKST